MEALTRQEGLFGPGGGASDTTVLRGLSEFADHLGADGLPGRKLSAMLAGVRAVAWKQIVTDHDGQLPAVRVAEQALTRTITNDAGVTDADAAGVAAAPVTVLRVDATIIESATMKPGVAGHYKGGIGYHLLTVWCSNIGDNLAVMQRAGNAGSFTASDHVTVLDHALGQVPALHRADVLVTIDGAGASHDVIDHLTRLNTHTHTHTHTDTGLRHGRRGRRVEYSIGWPVDTRTRTGIADLPDGAWGPGLSADGAVDADAQVAELTGLLRHGPDGDLLGSWPADLRVIPAAPCAP